jgi:hypothetical protein
MASGVLVSHVKANGEQLLVVYLLFCGARGKLRATRSTPRLGLILIDMNQNGLGR